METPEVLQCFVCGKRNAVCLCGRCAQCHTEDNAKDYLVLLDMLSETPPLTAVGFMQRLMRLTREGNEGYEKAKAVLKEFNICIKAGVETERRAFLDGEMSLGEKLRMSARIIKSEREAYDTHEEE